jgi:hypothetical protein
MFQSVAGPERSKGYQCEFIAPPPTLESIGYDNA